MKVTFVKTLHIACATLALTALLAAPHQASAQVKTSVGSASNFGGTSTLFTFTPGTGPVNSGSTFGSSSTVAASTTNGAATLPGTFIFTSNATGAGSFDIKSIGGQTLLSGIFTGLTQNGATSDPTDFVITTSSVTYTGGSNLISQGFAAGDTGNLSLTFIGVNPGYGTGPQTASSFTSSYDVVAATKTPEPGALVVFGIMGAGMLGVVMLRRKQTGTLSA